MCFGKMALAQVEIWLEGALRLSCTRFSSKTGKGASCTPALCRQDGGLLGCDSTGPVGTVAQVSLREATEVLGKWISGSLGLFPGLRCIYRDGGPALQNHQGETK